MLLASILAAHMAFVALPPEHQPPGVQKISAKTCQFYGRRNWYPPPVSRFHYDPGYHMTPEQHHNLGQFWHYRREYTPYRQPPYRPW